MSFSGKLTLLVDESIQNYSFWPDSAVAAFHKERTPAEDIHLVEMVMLPLKEAEKVRAIPNQRIMEHKS